MKTLIRVLTVVLVTGATMTGHTAMAAGSTVAAAEFYPFVGNWHGAAQLAEAGQKPVKLKMQFHCVKASSGYAVRCNAVAKNRQMTITESDLMGVDPVSGQAHWYAITNQGETHDHLANWTKGGHMQAHYDWQQDGKKMREEINFNFVGKTMKFRSIMLVDGKQAAEFSGDLKR